MNYSLAKRTMVELKALMYITSAGPQKDYEKWSKRAFISGTGRGFRKVAKTGHAPSPVTPHDRSCPMTQTGHAPSPKQVMPHDLSLYKEFKERKERKEITDSPQMRADLPEANPELKSKSPFQVYMDWVLSSVFALKPGDPNPIERKKVTMAYRRFGRAGQEIMAYAENDPAKAIDGTKAIAFWLQDAGKTWGLDTVAKWFPDWAQNPKEFNNGSAKTRT